PGWPLQVPCFVVTSNPPPEVSAARDFTFVDNVNDAINLGKDAAGSNLLAAHGASIAQQALRADQVDQIQVHMTPTLLGGGLRLFGSGGLERVQLKQTRVIESAAATHIMFRVVR